MGMRGNARDFIWDKKMGNIRIELAGTQDPKIVGE